MNELVPDTISPTKDEREGRWFRGHLTEGTTLLIPSRTNCREGGGG